MDVCFCNLEEETNNAIALFGDKEAGSVVLLKNFESYYNGYDENGKHFDSYVELIDKLKTLFHWEHCLKERGQSND